ncbi:nuclear transport factor 2 family protein [Prescottella sp. R16]|uniref:nuclear transport factor 2 family protein n=1 Tax=Prescottella sp. R16 TaxID=3064529 RepID=UPI00272E62D9|nr:nuclear transport factor 2 family protein [Prescottella sp. R16]
MPIIDPTKTWEPLQRRLETTSSERQRVVLSAVIEHMKAEAEPNLDRLMDTLNDAPDYHFWHAGHDRGPKGTDGVRTYYADFVASRSNVLEYAIDRLVLDDDCLVTEGFLKQIYPGSYAAQIGIPVDDESAYYLVVSRQLILWPVDADGKIQGEDSYHSGPASVTVLTEDQLPEQVLADAS